MPTETKRRVPVDMPAELHDAVREWAAANGESVATTIRAALRDWLASPYGEDDKVLWVATFTQPGSTAPETHPCRAANRAGVVSWIDEVYGEDTVISDIKRVQEA